MGFVSSHWFRVILGVRSYHWQYGWLVSIRWLYSSYLYRQPTVSCCRFDTCHQIFRWLGCFDKLFRQNPLSRLLFRPMASFYRYLFNRKPISVCTFEGSKTQRNGLTQPTTPKHFTYAQFPLNQQGEGLDWAMMNGLFNSIQSHQHKSPASRLGHVVAACGGCGGLLSKLIDYPLPIQNIHHTT